MSECSSRMHWKTKALLCVLLVGITTALRLPYYESSCNPLTEFQCDENSWTGTFCLPISLRCNGKSECMDRSDEYGCNAWVREKSHCGEEEFTFDNDKCYPDSWRCDGIVDCYDNTDEQKCQGTTLTTVTTPTAKTTTSAQKLCAKGDFMCADGERCCPNTWRCDDIIDCNDGSDEHHCQVATNAPVLLQQCATGMVPCDHGKKCVYNAWKCDRIVDCLDGSDESDCQDHVPKTDKTIVLSFEDLLHRHKRETRNKRPVELSAANRPRLFDVIGNKETENSEH
ncbi:low-density lipoprotein receptor 2-like isoform X2 [Mytilus californianus]|uniref:low-density lipoprotein receptor 2-like isoform X2 n=1 Tax=Mytilus californianus TaxID=6549 RepID=UPI00224765AE|nr:low-density lipoprotein receptor 2-like isoform X2 [Mytilus californianus]